MNLGFLIVLGGLLVCSCVKNTPQSLQNTPQNTLTPETYAFDGSSLSTPNPSWPEVGLPERMREILEKAGRMQIYEIEPCTHYGTTLTRKKKGKFQGCKILRQANVIEAEQKEKLVTTIRSAIESSPSSGAACFQPRHGIRAEHDGKRVELLICFECLNFQGASSLGSFTGGFSRAAEKVFEQFLNRK